MKTRLQKKRANLIADANWSDESSFNYYVHLFNIYTCCAASMLLARVETKWSTFIYAWCVLHIAFKYFTLYIYNWIHGVHLQDNPRWDTIFMLSATEFLPFLAKQDWQDKLLIMKHKCFGETWVLWNCTKITKM